MQTTVFWQLYLSYALLSALALMAVSAILSVFLKSGKWAFVGTVILLMATAAASFILLWTNSSFSFFQIFRSNTFSDLFFGIFSIAIALIEVLSYKQSSDLPAFSMMLSFVTAGVFLVTFAYSIISILVGLEMVALSSTFMVMANGKKFVEPAVKLFLLTAISIAIFTFALALLLPYDNGLALTLATSGTAGSYLLGLSLILFAGALSIDAAAFPFNLWVPDVYEGSPSNITALLAGVNKKVSFVAILEIFVVVFAAYGSSTGTPLFQTVFFAIAILTMFFGNLVALTQKSVKRLFAYSSISQAGYIFIGISAGTLLGIGASIFYMFAHMFMIIGAFAIIMWLESKKINDIDDYTGLSSKNQFAAVSLTIIMLSMAGIPPLVGFTGKFLLFSSAVYANDPLLAFIGIINSFISIYYYAKVINQMFLKKEARKMRMDRNIAIVVAFCLVFIILVGVYPSILINASSAAASALGAA